MKNNPSAFFSKAALAFVISGVAALIINYIGSLLIYDELRLNWPIVIIIAALVGLFVYLSSLRRYTVTLEERIDALEQKLKSK